MKKPYESLMRTLLEFGARFSATNPTVSPIPVEVSFDEALNELKTRLVDGAILAPPQEAASGGVFSGIQIIAARKDETEPRVVIHIHTDLKDRTAIIEQRVIAHSIIALVIQEWIEGADRKAEAAKNIAAEKGEAPGVVEEFPGAKIVS